MSEDFNTNESENVLRLALKNEIILGTHGRSLYVSKLGDVQGLKKDPEWMKNKPKERMQERRRFEDID